MDKGRLHHLWVKLKPVSYWYFLLAFVIVAFIAVFALRHNNLTAIHLRDEVYQADKTDGNVTAALNNLRGYVYSHMNTNLASPNGVYPPIQLQYTYQRLEQQIINQASSVNSALYTKAEDYCQQQIPNGFSGRYRISCIDDYISQNGSSNSIATIPESLYEFDFVAPFWSPDLAGWSIVVAALLLLLFIIRFGLERWMHHTLKEHL